MTTEDIVEHANSSMREAPGCSTSSPPSTTSAAASAPASPSETPSAKPSAGSSPIPTPPRTHPTWSPSPSSTPSPTTTTRRSPSRPPSPLDPDDGRATTTVTTGPTRLSAGASRHVSWARPPIGLDDSGPRTFWRSTDRLEHESVERQGAGNRRRLVVTRRRSQKVAVRIRHDPLMPPSAAERRVGPGASVPNRRAQVGLDHTEVISSPTTTLGSADSNSLSSPGLSICAASERATSSAPGSPRRAR